MTLALLNACVWRAIHNQYVRGGLLCASSILITPYAYNYELIVLIAPAAALILCAKSGRWLPYEREALVLGWLFSSYYPLIGAENYLQLPFCFALAAVFLMLRRVRFELSVNGDRGQGDDIATRIICKALNIKNSSRTAEQAVRLPKSES